MPLELSEFPEEVQVAFFMFSLLPDHWEGMSGTYMGKYWDGLNYFFGIYEVENSKIIFYFMKMWERILVAQRAEDAEKRRKADERKAKMSAGGGKQYTHNVQG